MAKFKYHGREKEDVERRAKQSSGRYDSYISEEVTWFRPKSGENCIRLIPWLNKSDKDFEKYDEKWGNHWGVDIIVHRNVGPDNGAYLCLDKMKGEPCPVCEAWRTDAIDDFKPGDRVLCWLIDRNNEKAGPMLWSMPLGVSKDISAVSEVKGSGELLLIDSWDDGFDVFFDKEGEKARTQYKRISVDRNSSPLSDDEKQQDRWLEYVFDNRLPDILKFYDVDYLEKVLSGQKERGKEGDEGEGNAPRRRRPSEGEDNDREETSSRGRRGRDDTEEEGSSRGRRGSEDREERSSRGRGGDAEEESPRRRRSEDESEGKEERGSRWRGSEKEEEEPAPRRRRGEEEPEERDRKAEADNEETEARSSRRRRGGDEEEEPSRKGRSEEKEEAEPESAVESARGRLKRVGRR